MFNHILIPEPTDSGVGILSAAFGAAMSAPNPSAAIQTLLETLGKTFRAKRAYVYQLPPGGTEFLCMSEWCAPGVDPMSEVTHGLTMAMASRWFGDGNIRSLIAIRNLDEFAEFNPQYAALFAPRAMRTQVLGKLMRGNHPLGTLGFDDPDEDTFDSLCSLMYPICAFATSTLNTLNLLGRFRSIGMLDPLTRTGTRLGFYQKAEHLPQHVPVGMAYLDVVGLQAINDIRGHTAGDETLLAVRQILSTEFQDDQLFRMGGDEFLVLAIGMSEEAFREALTRIRKRLDDLSTYIAMGVGWRPSLGEEYDALVRHAWLECNNAKREWERRGGKRLDLQSEETLANPSNRSTFVTQIECQLDHRCYKGEEFYRRANIWINHAQASSVCMVALDINYFKLYNDIFGWTAGDALLEKYASAVVQFANAHHGVPGYLGGDNFALVFPLNSDTTNEQVADVLKRDLGKYDAAEGFSPSLGAAITDDLGMGITVLYDRALVALQKIKGSYTEHIAFYDKHRYERDRENQVLIMRAQEGIAREEFTFFLQPKIDIITNKVVSAEALVRWHRNGELVPPFKFIGLMEQSGYIFALDKYVWDKVCAWQRSLIDRGIHPIPISVNVSRVDFYFVDLAEHFKKLIRKYDLSAELIQIEVTESTYSRDIEHVNSIVHSLQENGFSVFMDDFGSGYSSLNMLRSVSVNAIKMDKGFIDHANIQNGSDAIISNVIAMAHEMRLPVISEGVETKDQRDSLRRMGCDYVQGYFYYKPMPMDAFEEILLHNDQIELSHSDDIIIGHRHV